jgi:SAM-dependent methyltransferase
VLYRDDLAYIHDAAFGEIARSAALVLLAALERAGIGRGLVVDLGCGSGIFAERVAGAGYDVLGIDASRPMLRLARQRVPGATFRRGSLHDVELPKAVAVAGIGESFNYFVGRPISEHGLRSRFRRIHRALLPRGILLFDMAAPGRVRGGDAVSTHFEARDWAMLVTNEEDRRRKILTRRITSFRKEGSRYRRTDEIHRQRLFEKTIVLRLLREAGFRARSLSGYGELRFPRGLVSYLASKAASER